MLKVIIYLNDRAERRPMTLEERSMMQGIEIAASTSLTNWRMPYKLKMLYFISETDVMDYRSSVKNRDKYLFVPGDEIDSCDDDSVEEPPELLTGMESLQEPLMPGQTASQVYLRRRPLTVLSVGKPRVQLAMAHERLGTVCEANDESGLGRRASTVLKSRSPDHRFTSFQSITSVDYDEDTTPKKDAPLYRTGPFSQSKVEYYNMDTKSELSAPRHAAYASQICQTPNQFPAKSKVNVAAVKEQQRKFKDNINYYHMIQGAIKD